MQGSELIQIMPDVREGAENLGIAHLRMAVWYNPAVVQDREFGEGLFQTLTALGCNTYSSRNPRSPEGILGGEEIRLASRRLLRDADLVHIIVSRRGVQTENRLFFLGLNGAADISDEKPSGKIFIVPIRLNQVPLPYAIERLEPLDLYAGDHRSAVQRLLRTWQVAASQYPRHGRTPPNSGRRPRM